MKFAKLHGLSNDYVFVETFTQPEIENPGELSVRLSKPHTGIGADGLILLGPTDEADANMRIFNADGSEAQICGNGLRCAAKYLYELGICPRDKMRVKTGAGIKDVFLRVSNGRVDIVTCDMGAPESVSRPERLSAAGRTLSFVRVSMGNPHAVTFDEPAHGDEFYALGPAFERHAAFKERANIEFCEVQTPNEIRVRVWERGSGETMACGSGACATIVAAVSLGLSERRARVALPGGSLSLEYRETDGHVLMTGPATLVFTGEIEI